MVVLAALAAASLVSNAAPRAPAASGLEFKGASLGMTLAAWKASPFPGAEPARPVCATDPGAGAAGLQTSPAERGAGALVCTYAYTGPGGPRVYIPLDGGLIARKVRYVFQGGRLVSIGYRASLDAFDTIVARIDAQIGSAASVTRDRVRLSDGAVLPRVRMRWTSAAGVVTLTDPIATGRMSVVLSAPGYTEAQPQIG